MEFEYDPKKSAANKKKHGIDFETAKQLWRGPYLEFSAKQVFENRFALIAPLAGNFYTCIYTIRSEKIRLISCRRSRRKERQLYEENFPT